jgi:acetyl esterase/lipase
MRRREFLISAQYFVGAARAQLSQAVTYTYKTVEECAIRADVFPAPANQPGPAVVWIHGGALIMGSRKLPAASYLFQAFLETGFTVVSIDYRLAPETRLPAIVEDVQDAFHWVRSDSRKLNIDADRICVCGGSAGGYLTLMIGRCVQPAPRALASLWGYGDITRPWCSRPDPYYLRQRRVTADEAQSVIGRSPVSEADTDSRRRRFYLYCRQQGLWPEQVAGRNPQADASWFEAYCPVRNLTRAYPPTLLIHGTADTDVPLEESAFAADRLRAAGVEHRLALIDGAEHGLANVPVPERRAVYRDAARFLRDHV